MEYKPFCPGPPIFSRLAIRQEDKLFEIWPAFSVFPLFLAVLELFHLTDKIYTLPGSYDFRVIYEGVIDFVNNTTLLVDITARRDICFFAVHWLVL
ncbi:hypothetical protein ES703_81238 [subsurface metagenome]